MARGGSRPGAGRPKGRKPKWYPPDEGAPPTPPETREEVATAAEQEDISPLDYMLRVMRDPAEPKERRDKMAQLAAPFVHAKAGEKGGKKAEKEEAAKKAATRFAPAPGPKIVQFKQG